MQIQLRVLQSIVYNTQHKHFNLWTASGHFHDTPAVCIFPEPCDAQLFCKTLFDSRGVHVDFSHFALAPHIPWSFFDTR